MNPKVALADYKLKIDEILKNYFDHKINEYGEISEFSERFIRDLAEFTLRGGKRFRSALIYYAYLLFGGKDTEEIIKISTFIELIQSFLLIHDDIMDRSSLRRGNTTVHKIYEQYSQVSNFQDDVHFGTTMAILSGDLANQLALEIISESNFPYKNKNKLIMLVAREVSKVCFGQIHDILLNYNYPKNYTEKDVLKVHRYKTSTYTYRLPLFAGAILAGASDKDLELLDAYAIPSGIAFQIRDDILGVFGKSEETGKEIKSDLMEGKKTLLVTEAYEKANQDQRDFLDRYLGKKELTDSEADKLRSIFKDTGALEYSILECKRQIVKAKEPLRKLSDKNSEAFQFLESVADYMIVRNV